MQIFTVKKRLYWGYCYILLRKTLENFDKTKVNLSRYCISYTTYKMYSNYWRHSRRGKIQPFEILINFTGENDFFLHEIS